MDQVKSYLAVAVRHGFWIGCVTVLIGSIAIWYVSTGTLSEQTQAQASKIDQAVTKVKSVEMEVDTLPNDLSHAEMQKLIEARQSEVLEAWQLLYDRQGEILTWPVEEVGQGFVDQFKDLIPIERYVGFPLKEQNSQRMLQSYGRYIAEVLPRIAKIGNTEWAKAKKGAAAKEDLTGLNAGPLVAWSSANQDEVEKELFPWSGSTPTTLEVYYSQENLWILEQLMKIVATVNGDAKQPYQAKIREILKIEIGKSVTFDNPAMISSPGRTASGMGAGGGGGGGAAGGMPAALAGMSFGGMASGPAAGSADEKSKDPADERYVDLKMGKIKATKLRSALKSKRPTDANLAVAKRVPVMLSFNMDQRAVPELLAVCGSADLMVEVKQVRMLQKGASAAADSGAGGGMGMGGGFGGGGGGGMMGGGDMDALASGGDPLAQADEEDEEEFPLDMNVEIYGIINIYNPPDPTQLGLEEVTKEMMDAEEAAEEEASGRGTDETPETPTQSNDELPTPQADGTDPNAVPDETPADPADGQPESAEPAEPDTAAPTPVAARDSNPSPAGS